MVRVSLATKPVHPRHDVNICKELFANVVLSGGTTFFQGIGVHMNGPTVLASSTMRSKWFRMITCHHANTSGSRLQSWKAQDCTSLCPKKHLSSTCHVSFFAAPDTDHKHKFSLTYLTYHSDNLTNTPKIFGTRSTFTLRCSTEEWRINTNPISHRKSTWSDKTTT